jgi:predicted acetyltransferase
MDISARSLRLRPLRLSDEPGFLAAHRAMEADDFPFGLFYEPGMPWTAYVDQQRRLARGLDVPTGLVPSTFLVAEVDGDLVGRASIRHEFNDFVAREGGHIGYCVVPEHRRRGYATEILRQGLIVARSLGVDRVLVTCDDDNVGSAAVIEACGGELESRITGRDANLVRRYWID